MTAMQQFLTSADRTIARIAGMQHGLITTAQLLEAGLSPQAIHRRVRRGQLIRIHRGVHRVGHAAPSVEADYLAAVLACGEGAVLGGRAAAHLLGLVARRPPVIDVRAARRCRVPGVRAHVAAHRHPLDGAVYRHVPTLTVPATLVDVAAGMTIGELTSAAHEADVRHRTTPEAVEAAIRRRPRARGVADLRAVIHGDQALLLSRLETAFLALLRRHQLPVPVTNRREGAHYVDCRWPVVRLTVELDSYRFHRTRKAWEADRERERAARRRGDNFRRYTWRDVVEDPSSLLADLGPLLA